MSKDNRVQLPSSQGGLVRYDTSSESKIQIKPEVVVGICVLVTLAIIGLHVFLRK
ncbi:MAG: preprotein translocase subunit Sec61beta [Nanoarchaeota archaeon]|nr:MAG: preprotein translocase subunit Sec61beta [Nanoarchaeota archaeon]